VDAACESLFYERLKNRRGINSSSIIIFTIATIPPKSTTCLHCVIKSQQKEAYHGMDSQNKNPSSNEMAM